MRGVPVPPRGSLQDRILQETIQRERFQEYQKHAFLGRVLASIFGMDTQLLARAEETLELAVFQTAYDPTQIKENMERVQRALHVAREARLRDARLMARVASYTEPDDDDVEFPTGNRPVKFQGVTKPWTE